MLQSVLTGAGEISRGTKASSLVVIPLRTHRSPKPHCAQLTIIPTQEPRSSEA